MEVGADEAGSMHAFGFNHAGVERVDANVSRTQFLRQSERRGVNCAFGCTVHSRSGYAASCNRSDVDDAATFWIEALECCLRCEQKSENIDVELFVEMLGGERFERSKLVDARVVDQNVDGAELLDDVVDEGTDG